ncbi:MAG: hypothetical protein V4564_15530, partial [Pseudomonadota bacterium]
DLFDEPQPGSRAGRSIAGFVAPAWLYGRGAHEALASARIGLAEDHWKVWDAMDGRVLARSPVITWASRTPGRMASSLAVAAVARTVPTPRVISSTIAALSRNRMVSRYTDLIEDAARMG